MPITGGGDKTHRFAVPQERFVVISKQLRVFEQKLHQTTLGQPSVTLQTQRITPDKSTLFFIRAGKSKPRDQWRVIDDSPLVAGLGFTCAYEKEGGFIGRDALRLQRDAGLPKRRLVQFLLEDPQLFAYHNEPLLRDGKPVGFVTSAGYGHTLGACVAMAYVGCDAGVDEAFVMSGRYTIQLAEGRVPVTPSLKPLYDPRGERIRC